MPEGNLRPSLVAQNLHNPIREAAVIPSISASFSFSERLAGKIRIHCHCADPDQNWVPLKVGLAEMLEKLAANGLKDGRQRGSPHFAI